MFIIRSRKMRRISSNISCLRVSPCVINLKPNLYNKSFSVDTAPLRTNTVTPNEQCCKHDDVIALALTFTSHHNIKVAVIAAADKRL
jgi:hypothetical protein